MKPTPQLIDYIYYEKVLRARRTPAQQKLMTGPELFDFACEVTKADIRMQNPGVNERQVRSLLQ